MTDNRDRTERRSHKSTSVQSADLRRQNVSSVMRVILGHGSIARAEIARTTGLAPGSVTKLTSVLLSSGVCHELPVATSDRAPGRPAVPLAIDQDVFRVVGVHIGLLRTTIGVVDLTGNLLDEMVLTHSDTSFDGIVKQAVRRLRSLTSGRSRTPVLGIGASAGGVVDPESGVVLEHPTLDWHDAPLRHVLSSRLGLPVHVDNSVRALALTESWFGSGRDVGCLLHVFVGNIVGAAVVLDQRTHRGRRSAAGYLDHLPVGVRTGTTCSCGSKGCLQAVASDVALVAEGRRRGVLGRRQDLDSLVRLGDEGDKRAVALLRRRARYVGSAIALLVEILDPDRVVVGGGVVDDPNYLPEIRQAMVEHLHLPLNADPTDFVTATAYGRQAPARASATLCLDAFYRDPMSFPPLAE